MSVQFNNLIQNGSFETGDLTYWAGYNTTVGLSPKKTGIYAAQLCGTQYASLLTTIVVDPGESYILNASFAKNGTAISDQVNIYVRYFDKSKVRYTNKPVDSRV
jgi:heme/copper-type cytochrome/quinol oxidase subunit 2